MTDLTPTWVELLREVDEAARERERAKLEAMTPEEREHYLLQRQLASIVNMP